jgi:histidine ammonia-lyase
VKAVLTLAPGKLTLGMLRRIACGEARVVLEAATRSAIDASRAAVQQAVDHGAPAYGINTGFGKLAKTHIAHDQLERLQTNLVHSHAVGTGPLLDDATVRLVLCSRPRASRAGIPACGPK